LPTLAFYYTDSLFQVRVSPFSICSKSSLY
jgi:hypothetical protein